MSATPEISIDPAMADLSRAYTEAVRARVATLADQIAVLQAELTRLTDILASLEGLSTRSRAYHNGKTSISKRVTALLADGQVHSTRDLGDALQCNQASVNLSLSRLAKRGTVRRVDLGRYQATEAAQ